MLKQQISELLRPFFGHESDQLLFKFTRSKHAFHPSSPESLPLQHDESAAVSVLQPKASALFYDRIWTPQSDKVPESIRLIGDMEFESEASFFLSILHFLYDLRVGPREGWDSFGKWSAQAMKNPTHRKKAIESWDGYLTRTIAAAVTENQKQPIVPVFSSSADKDKEYQEGDYEVFMPVLANLQVVSEEALTWEQVIELRTDESALRDYRAMRHWLDKSMVGKSQQFIEDEIALKYERYQEAIRKHGLSCGLGCLESVFDWKYVRTFLASSGTVTLATGNPLLGLFVGTGTVVGGILCKAGRSLLDIREVRDANKEIAFVHELKSRLTKSNKT